MTIKIGEYKKALKMLSNKMNKERPKFVGFWMLKIAKDLLGDHSLAFDAELVRHIDSVEMELAIQRKNGSSRSF